MAEDRCGDCVGLSLRSVAEIIVQLGDSRDWLSAEEQARLITLTAPQRCAQFLAGRWLARQLLAEWLGDDWRSYQLSAAENGAPQLLAVLCSQTPHLSISHSGDWVACAVAWRPVGVDVEQTIRRRDSLALAEWIDTALGAELATLPQALQQELFYTHWTLREAWLKQSAGASMHQVRFAPGAAIDQGRVGRGQGVTVALYPATAAEPVLRDPLLRAMEWSDWACTPPR